MLKAMVYAVADVHYFDGGGARGALLSSVDPAFGSIASSFTVEVERVEPYRPGEFYRRELPVLRLLVASAPAISLLVIDGYATLDAAGRPGLGAHAHAAFGVPVIGVAKTRFRSSDHAVPVLRGSATKPLWVTAAGHDLAAAAALVSGMSGAHRLPAAVQAVDRLARTGFLP